MEFLAKVFVTPKAAVLDPQGKAVATSLQSMGYDEVVDVRVGKLVLLRVRGADCGDAGKRVEEMCKRLLANEVIEDFRYELDEDGAGAR